MAANDELIARWLEEVPSDEEDLINGVFSDVEDDVGDGHVLEEISGSDSEIEGEEEPILTNLQTRNSPSVSSVQTSSDDDVPLLELRSRPRKKNFFGKNRFRWSSEPPHYRSRTLQHNIVLEKEGVKPEYRTAINASSTPLDIWSKFFTDDILNKIVQHTNQKIREIRPKYNKQTNVQDIDLIELKAFIGLLFYTAIFKENREHYTSWYKTDGSGREIYRCIMSKSRFEVLLNTIRFDDATTRAARRETDASAPISELFDSFIKQCQAVYSIGSYACVDEMLLAFRGRCRFKMYMPKKPAKYGLKILCITDARTGYLLNAYIYLGKDSDGLNLPSQYNRLKKPTQAVMRLISPIEGSNRNVTTDNWFTSLELADLLKEKQLTLVGTLRKNQREIPSEFLPSRYRHTESCLFGFTKDVTLASFVPKPNKAVIMLSSMHHSPEVDDSTKKPEIILFYNSTKFGVDLLDQRCSNYSTARRTRRWPLAIFYRLLDVSTSNAYVVSLSAQAQKKETRFHFIKMLAEQLTRPYMERRVKSIHIQRDLKFALRRILQIHEADTPAVAGGSCDKLEIRKVCSTCDPKKKRKTQYLCFNCKVSICLECSNKLCIHCRENR
ncbi:piggyBac transposable element-derived protein 4-like [Hyposmocoma kahamanoa]|uniref:piggyBac transposable element-derived protein 4-like n=1 Tax=Hyposmocoma kahamanoa TaxID=1477025 RepID=UPI000E6D704C|nr:piggyBac transposable element-derived protein 4-like [Hyposmocoma kahamanoa]